MSFVTPDTVRIVEVGPRDGLQNEAKKVPVETRIELIQQLADAGITTIESGSFVSPRWIPQMADSEAVFEGIRRVPGVRYTCLTPNMKGLERAIAAKASEVAVFAAASESFSQKNINCSINESIQRFTELCHQAGQQNIPVRGYISCALGCPYEGDIPVANVQRALDQLLALGCHEVSIGDTIGVGTAKQVEALLMALFSQTDASRLAVHFHDTYGQALANILVALQMGISVIDSSVAGLGGCPYAKGASGNVATEDVLYMLHGMSIETGIDLHKLIRTSHWISQQLGREPQSRVARALASDTRTATGVLS